MDGPSLELNMLLEHVAPTPDFGDTRLWSQEPHTLDSVLQKRN